MSLHIRQFGGIFFGLFSLRGRVVSLQKFV